MVEECPLCTVPTKEKLLYEDGDLYLVPTKERKGHDIRIMVCSKKHIKEPTFPVWIKAVAVLMNYMERTLKKGKWFIVEGTYASVKDHFHIVACDEKGTLEELELLYKTPKAEFPLLSQKKILIGIPAYNEERTISTVVSKAGKFGEVMVVDDGSADRTSDLAISAGAGVTENDENYGYGYCISKIFREAKRQNYDILITLDADGQHNPDEIPVFIQAIENGADVVIGNRFIGETKIPKYRKLGIGVVSRVEGVGDAQCGFRAYNKEAINSITIKERGMGASLEILHRVKDKGLKMVEIPCTVLYENTEHSKNPLFHGTTLIESILWSRIWRKPLTYLGLLGFAIIGLGMISSIQLMTVYAQHRVFVISWALLSLGGILGGLLLIVTAVLVYLIKRGLEEIE